MLSIFVQLIVDGLAMGLVYVLLASGFNLIIGISRILFVAYGEFYMLGAWIVWGLMVPMKLPFLVALCAATLAPAILGGLVYVVIFRFIQFKEQQFLTNIVAAMGLMLLLSQSALFVFGTESRGIPSVIRGMVDLGGIRMSYEKVALIVLTLAVLIGLHLLLQKTKIGRAMRAVSCNADVAALQGVNANVAYLGTMAVGCALAGFAGGVMAPVFAVSPKMGGVTLLIILVVMLGGVGSMPGAILSGLILGLTLSFGQYFIGSGVAQILFFAVIAIILFFRPGGLFGQAEEIPL
ncbi:MAG: branched-chain amino acid ABC transporter permease [Deltaproteobacteria bacterium]|nr:branched-chain amino acid ABC transporter permease [Deltaproteobacteria bacterium]